MLPPPRGLVPPPTGNPGSAPVWATGVPLNHDDCLDRSMWLHQGILGEILMEVCSELKRNDYSPPVNTPLSRNQSNREHNRYDSTTNSAIPEHLLTSHLSTTKEPPLYYNTTDMDCYGEEHAMTRNSTRGRVAVPEHLRDNYPTTTHHHKQNYNQNYDMDTRYWY